MFLVNYSFVENTADAGSYSLRGHVFDSPTYPDGELVTTSSLSAYTNGLFRTGSGSQYMALIPASYTYLRFKSVLASDLSPHTVQPHSKVAGFVDKWAVISGGSLSGEFHLPDGRTQAVADLKLLGKNGNLAVIQGRNVHTSRLVLGHSADNSPKTKQSLLAILPELNQERAFG